MSGVRGTRMVVEAIGAMGRAPTQAVRAKARAAALEPTLQAEKRHLRMQGAFETGALEQSLGKAAVSAKRTVMGPRKGTFGPEGRRPSSYQHLVEFGTAPHWQPNRLGGIMHPGARPKPHVRPAVDETRDQWPRLYAEVVVDAIRKAAASKARRKP